LGGVGIPPGRDPLAVRDPLAGRSVREARDLGPLRAVVAAEVVAHAGVPEVVAARLGTEMHTRTSTMCTKAHEFTDARMHGNMAGCTKLCLCKFLCLCLRLRLRLCLGLGMGMGMGIGVDVGVGMGVGTMCIHGYMDSWMHGQDM